MNWRKIPFLRWSFWRLIFGMKHLTTEWQVGDGREARLADFVLARARRGDATDVIRVIDEYCYEKSFLINVGDEKGRILDSAVAAAKPSRILELGTYCGYSALRMAAAAPSARIVSIEFNAANADIARRILDHAGVGARVVVVVGTLGDGGRTIEALRKEHGLGSGSVDLVFIDHDKSVYLPDLRLILDQGWLRQGALVVADNIKFPGAPEYRAYMTENEGKRWRTVEHETHVEYQSVIKDLVLVSEYLAASGDCSRATDVITYMVIERFRGGDPVPVYRRFREKGRLAPEGLRYVSSWVTEDLKQCFQVMECDDPNLLIEWMSRWSDLVEFEIIPVMTSAEAQGVVAPRL